MFHTLTITELTCIFLTISMLVLVLFIIWGHTLVISEKRELTVQEHIDALDKIGESKVSDYLDMEGEVFRIKVAIKTAITTDEKNNCANAILDFIKKFKTSEAKIYYKILAEEFLKKDQVWA